MSERCSHCKQFHLGVCNMPQGVCFQCGQTGQVKKYCLLLNNTRSVSQSLMQPSILIQGFGRSVVRPLRSSRSMTNNSSGIQGV